MNSHILYKLTLVLFTEFSDAKLLAHYLPFLNNISNPALLPEKGSRDLFPARRYILPAFFVASWSAFDLFPARRYMLPFARFPALKSIPFAEDFFSLGEISSP